MDRVRSAARLLICVLEVPGYSPVTAWIPLILKEEFLLFSTASPGNA
jgi:hypothetical protein